MEKLSSADEIWSSTLRKEDLQEATDYATISLPWTFDRMHYGGKTQRAINDRLLHIFLGVLNQSILERELKSRGYSCGMDWTKYRESDIFDFSIEGKIYDVKTMIVYSEYDKQWKRQPFSPELLIRYKSYQGPKWRIFFPIMVAMTQLTVDKMKDGYIFGIGKTYPDLRKREPMPRDKGFWCTAPYDKAFVFFQNTALVKAREDAGRGFFPVVKWNREQSTIDGSIGELALTFYGEWMGKPVTTTARLSPGDQVVISTEMSALSCIKAEHPSSLGGTDELVITAKNNFRDFVPRLTDPNENINDHKFSWKIGKSAFVNLHVPSDYTVYWLGYIPFKEFARTFTNYSCYFIPHPKNPDENTNGEYTGKLVDKFARLDNRRSRAISKGLDIPWPDFSGLVKGKMIKAGLLVSVNKAGGKPIGAACYYYPPYALLESAIYVLPKDLYTMDSLRFLHKRSDSNLREGSIL